MMRKCVTGSFELIHWRRPPSQKKEAAAPQANPPQFTSQNIAEASDRAKPWHADASSLQASSLQASSPSGFIPFRLHPLQASSLPASSLPANPFLLILLLILTQSSQLAATLAQLSCLPLSNQVHCVVEKPVDAGFIVNNFIQEYVAGLPARARDGINPSVSVDVLARLTGAWGKNKIPQRKSNQRSVILRFCRTKPVARELQNVEE
jgi:hypothetical protein